MPLVFNRFRSARHVPGKRPIQVLTRPGCHLCDDALAALSREFKADAIESVDILSDQALEDQYVFRIPVVLYHDEVLAEGIIDQKVAREVRRQVKRRNALETGAS